MLPQWGPLFRRSAGSRSSLAPKLGPEGLPTAPPMEREPPDGGAGGGVLLFLQGFQT